MTIRHAELSAREVNMNIDRQFLFNCNVSDFRRSTTRSCVCGNGIEMSNTSNVKFHLEKFINQTFSFPLLHQFLIIVFNLLERGWMMKSIFPALSIWHERVFFDAGERPINYRQITSWLVTREIRTLRNEEERNINLSPHNRVVCFGNSQVSSSKTEEYIYV